MARRLPRQIITDSAINSTTTTNWTARTTAMLVGDQKALTTATRAKNRRTR